MKPSKGFYCTIFEITEEELYSLIERFEKNQFTECDKQLYVYHDEKDDRWIAIDNTSGDFNAEDFILLSTAYVWLLGLKSLSLLKHAESKVYGGNFE